MSFEVGKIFDKAPRERINPYIAAAGLLLLRLKWDLSPLSWKSRIKLKRLKNSNVGQKAVILCNGPSLNKVNFNLLEKSSVFSFGLNKINLIFDKTDFRPNCIVSVNPYVIEQNKDFYNSTDLPVFLDSIGKKTIKFRKNIYFLHSAHIAGRFARDCSISIVQGSTVTYVAMQLAFHMGFKEVALTGCDHSFHTQGPANKKISAGEQDPNHFDPNYFSNGVTWQLPDLKSSEFHYEKARDNYFHFGRRLVNCTEGGKLEIFERMSLEEFLNSQSN